jgi:hypothetical protein
MVSILKFQSVRLNVLYKSLNKRVIRVTVTQNVVCSCFSSYLSRHFVSIDTGLSSCRCRLRSRCSWGADNHHTSACGQNKVSFISTFYYGTKEESNELSANTVTSGVDLQNFPPCGLLSLQKHCNKGTELLLLLLLFLITGFLSPGTSPLRKTVHPTTQISCFGL